MSESSKNEWLERQNPDSVSIENMSEFSGEVTSMQLPKQFDLKVTANACFIFLNSFLLYPWHYLFL